ncbi:ABC transporter substrate-binding protein [Paludifilum halophilum]|uniref:ABC transporter substrate-binding protein n=1 Tax=Paludifilum halophilum TaxID=1642702 RepID=A0A235BA42_9BACL|nr:ABC transporter substrate-binding protein [Paludifilum halophilum]
MGIAFSLIGSLAACGGGSDQGAEGDGGQVTITYARGKDQTQTTKKLIEEFEKEHPQMDIRFKEMPSDTGVSHDQYVTMFSGNSDEIDVFDLDVIWSAEFAQAGYLQPLDRFIQKDGIDLDKYVNGAVKAGRYNGKQWTMPKFVDAGLLYYRKDMVDEEDVPKTWEALTEQAEELKGEQGTSFGYVFQGKQYEGLVCNFIELIGAYGGRVLDEQGKVVIDSKGTVEGLRKLREMAQSDYVPGHVTAITEIETDAIYSEGQAVFSRQWPYHYAKMQEDGSDVMGKVGVAALPQGDAGSTAALGGWMTGINKNSKHKKEAWELIKFMNGAKGQKISAVDGGLAPTYLPLYQDEDVKKASPLFENEEFIKGVKSAVPRPVSPEYPKISDIIQVEVSKTIAGEEKPENAVKRMEQKLKKVVEGG